MTTVRVEVTCADCGETRKVAVNLKRPPGRCAPCNRKKHNPSCVRKKKPGGGQS